MPETQTHAEEIVEEFSDHLDLSVEDVQERFEELVGDYKVPVREARESIRNSYLKEAGLEQTDIEDGESEETLVGDINEDEEWVELNVKVAELWEPRSDSVAQVGLVGDESGRTRFVAFETSDLDKLEEGASYNLKNVVTDEYQGEYSVKLNKTTQITKLEEDIEVGENKETVEGALVDIQSGSGLIKRCPEEGCTRVLSNKRCSEHGDVEGEFDMRIKAVIDDGDEAHEVIFQREATEELAEMDMEEAKQKAMDALDTKVISDQIRENIVGTYFQISGPEIGRYTLADEFEKLSNPTNADSLLARARSI